MVARRLALARAEVFAIPRCREIHGRSTKSRLHRHSLGFACGHCGGIYQARQSRARRTDGPAVQVNHIVPALGLHSALDCVHHQENLEVLCEPCHRLVTTAQARDRRNLVVAPPPGALEVEALAPGPNAPPAAEPDRMRTMSAKSSRIAAARP